MAKKNKNGSVVKSEAKTEIYMAEDLLNNIENTELLKALLSVIKLTFFVGTVHISRIVVE